MYQIAVCDDEQSDLNQAVQLTERILQEADIPCAVTAYGSGAREAAIRSSFPPTRGISASLSGTSGTPSPAGGTPACTSQRDRRSSGSPSPGWRSACRNRSSSTATELFWSIWPLFTGSGSGIWSSPAGKLFRSAVTASLRCVRRCWISLMPEGNGLTEPVKSAPCSIRSREP